MSILRIALPVPLPGLFDYLPPQQGEARPGCRVVVPFGRKRLVGLVVAQVIRGEFPPERLKQVEAVLDPAPLLDKELRQTLAWAADYWPGALGEAWFQALPLLLREPKPAPALIEPRWQLSPAGEQALRSGRRRGFSQQLLQQLAAGPQNAAQLERTLPGWRTVARRLEKTGLLIQAEPALPLRACPPYQASAHLSTEQRAACDAVAAEADRYQPFLLDGITGSGKTEVYLELIGQTLARGRQVLLLIPEIGLAPQTGQRLAARFQVPIEVLHSNLSEGARARAWLRARAGLARIVLGTRSAVFTPLPEAGLIIVDEEHDASYKQQEGFRYHARDLALVRARALAVPVLLGSATPSLESRANAGQGRYRHLKLRTRPAARQSPKVQLLDLRGQYLEHGLSPALLAALDETQARGEQALVFRNRRGYAPVLICHACGWYAECPRCERSLTFYRQPPRLACHHCDYQHGAPTTCPACQAGPLSPQGLGTERLEEVLQLRYPSHPVLRIDRDTTRRRDSFDGLLERLREGESAILVGTQMLAKGHDLPHLTLVAIASLDEGLHSVDFRANERLAQLIVQVAGRAGRADKPGRVLLQTHHPDHPLLQTLLNRGYEAVAESLLAERQALQLPPYSHQALLRADAHREQDWRAFLSEAAALLASAEAIVLAGPMSAPMPLRAGRQRGQLLLESARRAPLHRQLKPWYETLHTLRSARRVRWSLDVDPIDLY